MVLEPSLLKSYVAEMQQALLDEDIEKAASYAGKLSAGRIAIILGEAPKDTILPCLRKMPVEKAGVIFGHFPPDFAAELLDSDDANTEDAATLLSAVPVDRAADIIAMLPDSMQNVVLEKMLPESREVINDLMHFEQGSTGASMLAYYLAIKSGSTVADTMEAVTDAPAHIEHKTYIYVVNDERRLLGVVSLKDLIRRKPTEIIDSFMETDVVAVSTSDPAIDTARIMRNRRYRQLPVLDDQKKLSGIMVLDDAMSLLARDIADQFTGMGAASVDESFYSTPTESIKKRLPWMAGNIFLNLGAVAVISSFEDTIAAVAVLAVFLPMITDMGGNVGIQALSVSIRSMALGEARLRDFWKACRKEVVIGLVNGVVLGTLFAVIAWGLRGDPLLGALAGVALGVNVLVAGIVGGSLPFLIKRLGKDPAMMTGPVLTTITDITGVTIYLGLATLFLSDLLM